MHLPQDCQALRSIKQVSGRHSQGLEETVRRLLPERAQPAGGSTAMARLFTLRIPKSSMAALLVACCPDAVSPHPNQGLPSASL